MFLCTQKRNLPNKVGENNLATRLFISKNMENKTFNLHIRLTKDELNLFKKKSASYKNTSAMIIDSVKHFDDNIAIKKIDMLNNVSRLILLRERELSGIGNNINQIARYLNQLAISKEYSSLVVEQEVMPCIQTILKLIEEINRESKSIFRKSCR